MYVISGYSHCDGTHRFLMSQCEAQIVWENFHLAVPDSPQQLANQRSKEVKQV